MGDLLGSKPFTNIGLISYPLYLWHFPVFAFGRIYSENMGWAIKVAIIFTSLILAYLTFQFVEKYTRSRTKFSFRGFSI